mmetsp:Transcript_69090/g.200496  ORF Transcript_69090/g.200496 Transcript_69090/m.200496 type:complete len:357 (+) Transcript_69090:444-1514(+)
MDNQSLIALIREGADLVDDFQPCEEHPALLVVGSDLRLAGGQEVDQAPLQAGIRVEVHKPWHRRGVLPILVQALDAQLLEQHLPHLFLALRRLLQVLLLQSQAVAQLLEAFHLSLQRGFLLLPPLHFCLDGLLELLLRDARIIHLGLLGFGQLRGQLLQLVLQLRDRALAFVRLHADLLRLLLQQRLMLLLQLLPELLLLPGLLLRPLQLLRLARLLSNKLLELPLLRLLPLAELLELRLRSRPFLVDPAQLRLPLLPQALGLLEGALSLLPLLFEILLDPRVLLLQTLPLLGICLGLLCQPLFQFARTPRGLLVLRGPFSLLLFLFPGTLLERQQGLLAVRLGLTDLPLLLLAES